jgi:hypothetical protein
MATDSVCCCSYTSNICLKPVCWDSTNPKKNLGLICLRNRCMLVDPKVCCRDHTQVLTFDHRCSCPSNDEVPCMLTFPWLPFLTLCINNRCAFRCCMSLGDVKRFYHSQGNGYDPNSRAVAPVGGDNQYRA